MKTEILEKKHVIVEIDDIKRRFPDKDFSFEVFYSYDDEIPERTIRECMPDESKYKKYGVTDFENFVNDWYFSVENRIMEYNREYVSESIDSELRELVKEKLKKEWIEYDSFDFDFYTDELYSIDYNVDWLLSRSFITRNILRLNNYDWFSENETYKDWNALKEFIDLNTKEWLKINKDELEKATHEGIYEGSDLKFNIKSNVKQFFDTLKTWKINISWLKAVLHLSINGSWSPEFELWEWEVTLWKTLKTVYDRWDWNIDNVWYSVTDTYWCSINDF